MKVCGNVAEIIVQRRHYKEEKSCAIKHTNQNALLTPRYVETIHENQNYLTVFHLYRMKNIYFVQ